MFINLFCKQKRENVCELQDAEMIGIKQNDLPVNFSLENMVIVKPRKKCAQIGTDVAGVASKALSKRT